MPSGPNGMPSGPNGMPSGSNGIPSGPTPTSPGRGGSPSSGPPSAKTPSPAASPSGAAPLSRAASRSRASGASASGRGAVVSTAPYNRFAAATGNTTGGEGGDNAVVTRVVWNAWLKVIVPEALVTLTPPTEPSSSGSRVMTLCSPSAAAWPATLVPRMPIVATGVRTTICSGPLAAISPETNTNTPCSTENAALPDPVSGS